MITIAVDCMGGDSGVGVTLPACRRFLERHPNVSLLLVGKADAVPRRDLGVDRLLAA